MVSGSPAIGHCIFVHHQISNVTYQD